MKNIMYRWVSMFSALVAAVAMNYFTVLSFQPDRGIIYIRSYEMTQTVFRVTQTKLDNSEESEVVAVISLKWLNRAKWAIIAMTILCTLCFFSNKLQITVSLLTLVVCVLYYVILIYYAIQISDEQFPTMYPTLAAVLPAIVMQMMILLRKNILQDVRHRDETMDFDD